jgi:hypothetical protein
MNFVAAFLFLGVHGIGAIVPAERFNQPHPSAKDNPWFTGPLPAPAVVSIDTGRQLFVDDYLVESTTLVRRFHQPEWHAKNPVLTPDRAWEGSKAMPFSDGVWYDPTDRLFKMWYTAGTDLTCYAVSRDGIGWEKPDVGVEPGTNIVLRAKRDSSTVVLDREERDPAKRFKLFRTHNGPHPLGYSKGIWAISIHYSPDGIHWSGPVRRTGWAGDRSTVFYNPFRQAWVYSLRNPEWHGPRKRFYWESRDLEGDITWDVQQSPPLPWIAADEKDAAFPGVSLPAQLYNLDCVAYESVLLGLFAILRGDFDNRSPVTPGRPKPNNVCIGFSRDGFNWERPDRRPFADYGAHAESWNWGNVQSVGGGCLVVGEKLYFYFSGRRGAAEARDSGGSTGLAILRRDGFASMDAGPEGGIVTTKTVRFSGHHLFVNCAAAGGELRVEILDEHGQVIPEFSADRCVPWGGESTAHEVQWRGADFSRLVHRAVRLRFHLRKGALYSFWTSATASGASLGYVGAGGPGFTGARDTVGHQATTEASNLRVGNTPVDGRR